MYYPAYKSASVPCIIPPVPNICFVLFILNHSFIYLLFIHSLFVPASAPRLVCGMVHIKDPLLLIEQVANVISEHLSRYLNDHLPYVPRHITEVKCVEFLVK